MCWLFFVALLQAQVPEAAPARVDLVAAHDAVVPGQRVTLGIRIRHAPGWHTYWKNPGTVGVATKIHWKLPKGCRAGPILWPRPELTKMRDYTVWGYERDALLLCEVSIPAAAAANERLRFAAEVRYLACSSVCRPGVARIALELPVRAKAKPIEKHAAAFAAVRRSQPRALRDAWSVSLRVRRRSLLLTLTPKAGANPNLEKPYFFAEQRTVSSDGRQFWRRDGERWIVRLPRETRAPANVRTLRGWLYSAAGFLRGGSVQLMQIAVAWPR